MISWEWEYVDFSSQVFTKRVDIYYVTLELTLKLL